MKSIFFSLSRTFQGSFNCFFFCGENWIVLILLKHFSLELTVILDIESCWKGKYLEMFNIFWKILEVWKSFGNKEISKYERYWKKNMKERFYVSKRQFFVLMSYIWSKINSALSPKYEEKNRKINQNLLGIYDCSSFQESWKWSVEYIVWFGTFTALQLVSLLQQYFLL